MLRERKRHCRYTRKVEQAIVNLYQQCQDNGMVPMEVADIATLKRHYAEARRPRGAKPIMQLPPLWRFRRSHGKRIPLNTRLKPAHLGMLYQCAAYLQVNLTDALCEALSYYSRDKIRKKTGEDWFNDFLDRVELRCEPQAVVVVNEQVETAELA